ncbi:MAG: AmmeMemoRadiSam system protein A [Anaerolineaceae bacterium]|nr:AmmeMemoRadiSam system protein A [Anaerolineaceae bacterium]
MTDRLDPAEQNRLLEIARESLTTSVQGYPLPELNLEGFSPALRMDGASFVTLTEAGQLRGCIGALEAYQPLAKDVQEHAMAAALQDYRFPQVRPEELPQIEIEISILTPKIMLDYDDAEDLLRNLRPGVDGIVLQDSLRKATFLPQVWDQLPQPEHFLAHLCQKMGASPNLWRQKHLTVLTYQVQEFQE